MAGVSGAGDAGLDDGIEVAASVSVAPLLEASSATAAGSNRRCACGDPGARRGRQCGDGQNADRQRQEEGDSFLSRARPRVGLLHQGLSQPRSSQFGSLARGAEPRGRAPRGPGFDVQSLLSGRHALTRTGRKRPSSPAIAVHTAGASFA